MSREALVSLRNPWFAASVAITAAIAIVAALVGFVLLPLHHPGERFHGLWDAICSAAGVVRRPPSAMQIIHAEYPTTRVEIVPHMLSGASAESIGRGATLALRCTMCHGARGLSEANTPNLAGQYPVAIYKELVDFKTGARVSAVMAPLVADLSDANMRDLAAYYAYLPRVSANLPTTHIAPRIVASGAPVRGIAPCGACHGDLATKPGAAWLEGQPIVYLRAQLMAFGSGTRHNDIGEQMRNVARAMTPAEIDAASEFYGGQVVSQENIDGGQSADH
jgi:cytochrome c553